MLALDVNESAIEAMRKNQLAIHKGIQYDRILEYVLWYDSNGTLRHSVGLLQNRSLVRVPVDEITIPDQ